MIKSRHTTNVVKKVSKGDIYMRKTQFILLLMLGLISFILVACTPGTSIDVDQLLEQAQAKVTLQDNVTEDIMLPISVEVDDQTILITWVSDMPQVIGADGTVTRPTHDVGNVSVTLTATFSYEGETITAPFVVIVQALDAPTYTVTFDTDEGSNVLSQSIGHNQTAIEPSAPTKVGYTFSAWVDSDDVTFDFSTPITESITLFATYEPTVFNITYNFDEAATIQSAGASEYTIESTAIDLPVLTIEHGTFIGWALDSLGDDMVVNLDPMTLDDVTLFAIFEMDLMFTVTFNPNNDTASSDITMYSGLLEQPDNPTRIGYIFDGWYTESQLLEQFDFEADLITANTNLYAKWMPEVYSITYLLDSGVLDTSNPENYTIESDDIILNDAEKSHYEFDGWTLNGDAIEVIETGSYGDLVLTANYTPIAYTITYEMDEGTPVTDLKMTYTFIDDTFELVSLEKSGFYFEGWFDSPTDGNKVNEIPHNSFGELTLYARFYENVEVNYLDEATIHTAKNYMIYFEDNMTVYSVDQAGHIYVQGSNQLGFLGIGETVESVNEWISIQDKLGLTTGEYITDYYFEAPTIILITSNNRIITWGFQGFENDDIVIYDEPTDITALFNLNGASIMDVSHLFYNIAFITSDDRILMYNGDVTDVTPTLSPNETLKFTALFSGGEIKYSNVIFTGEKIYVHVIGTEPTFIDITSEFDFAQSETVLFIMSQNEGVHVITDQNYYFMMIIESETQGYDYEIMNVDLNLTLNSGETIVSSFSGGGLFTSSGRLLMPSYIIESEFDEMPMSVIYHDMTNNLELSLGETLIEVYEDVMIYTSNHRLLAVFVEDSFTTDPLWIPDIEIMPIDLSAYIITGTEKVGVYFVEYALMITIDDFAYMVDFYQEGIELTPMTIDTLVVIQSADTPVHMIQTFYIPPQRAYQAFDGWYLDQAHTILATLENIYDGINLYPKWVDTHYTITFELGFEYTGEPYIDIMGKLGTVPDEPVMPEREHYTFDGWFYFDESNNFVAYTFDTPLNQNIILYASFRPMMYDITFNYDLTETTGNETAWAFMQLEDIHMNLPYGYYIVGVYFDAAMTMPVPHDYEILDDYTFYVALAADSFDVYYYEQSEEMVFDKFFDLYQNEFAITDDGRVFGRGNNYNGTLGLDTFIEYFPEFVELTHLFNFDVEETLIKMAESNGTIIAYTTHGSVFIWGYNKGDNNYQRYPVDITDDLNIDLFYPVVYVYADHRQIYIYQSNGIVNYLDTLDDIHLTFNLNVSLNDPLLVSWFGNEETYIMVQTDDIIRMNYDLSEETVLVEDYSSIVDGQSIIDVISNVFTGTGHLAILADGTILSLNNIDLTVTIFDVITLQTTITETVQEVYFDGNNIMVQTNLNNYYQTTQTETTLIDSLALEVDEYIIGYSPYTGYYYTNLGIGYYFDLGTIAFVHGIDFAPHDGFDDYVEVVFINNYDYLYHTSGMYVGSGEMIEAAKFFVGLDLVVETPVTGEPYELRTPDERMGQMFDGWYETLSWRQEATNAPTSPTVYYGRWLLIVE